MASRAWPGGGGQAIVHQAGALGCQLQRCFRREGAGDRVGRQFSDAVAGQQCGGGGEVADRFPHRQCRRDDQRLGDAVGVHVGVVGWQCGLHAVEQGGGGRAGAREIEHAGMLAALTWA